MAAGIGGYTGNKHEERISFKTVSFFSMGVSLLRAFPHVGEYSV